MSHESSRILIFVQHPVVGELIAYRLKLLGLTPTWLNSEPELHAHVADALPHLFMIDLDMIHCDGLQIVETLASDEITSRIPILCLSAEGDLDRAEKAFQAGAREFLVVPFDPIVLEEKVGRMLEQFAQRNKSAGGQATKLAVAS